MQNEIHVGMRVSLIVPTDKNDRGKLSLPSVVEGVSEDDVILIQMPTYHGYYYPLPRDPIVMRFFVDSTPYSLPVIFEERIEYKDYMMAKMRRCGSAERHQLRGSFRLECSLAVEITTPTKKLPKNEKYEGITINLSEGGMLLSSGLALEQNDEITVTFDIGTVETIGCRVVRSDYIEYGKYKYRAGLMFNYKDGKQADRIYKYILNEQRAQMKGERTDASRKY